jgi:hypothetical protein
VRPFVCAAAAAAAPQVQKIRLLLRQRGLGAVRVGTVDDYQVRTCCNWRFAAQLLSTVSSCVGQR